MTGTLESPETDKQTEGVTIGDVEGGIHDSIIAGRDVIIYEGIKPVSAGDLLDACQVQVQSVLYDVRHKYDPKLYVNRAIERELDNFFDTPVDGPAPNCFLIVAPAGSGKTNLLCELARVRVVRQPVLLLMGGNVYIGATTGLLGAVQSELQAANSKIHFRSAEDSLHTLHRLAEELDRDALLMLDAINEYDRPAPMRKAVEDLLRKTRERRIRLVVTCRDYYWGLFKGSFWEGATVNELPTEDDEEEDEIGREEEDFSRFAADEHERALTLYLDHHQISGRPEAGAVEQLRHPLLLRFFCEAYRGQDVSEVEDIRLKELFDRYWSQKLGSIAERMIQQGDERLRDSLAAHVADYLLNVSAYMLHKNVRTVPLSQIPQATGHAEDTGDPRSIYGRVRDEFIILEEQERGGGRRKVLNVSFVYEEFMEYVMARSLMRDWEQANLDQAGILAEIEKLTGKYESFAQILGVMVYLALLMKEERDGCIYELGEKPETGLFHRFLSMFWRVFRRKIPNRMLEWGGAAVLRQDLHTPKRDLGLWSLLLNKGEHWQKTVFEAFRKLPEEQLDVSVFNTLGEMLATGDEDIRKQVLDTLKVKRVGKAASASVVSLTCELAKHEQVSISRRAVLALGNMPSDPAMAALITALGHSRAAIRNNAAMALGQLGDTRAVEPLIAALKDSTSRVQRSAIEALERLGDPRAVEPLIAALKDSNSDMRRHVAEALVKLGDAWTVESFIAALKDSNSDVRRHAAEALGRLGDARAVEPLIAVLKDSTSRVQGSATEALGRLGDARAVEPLIAVLKDSTSRVQGRAAEALRRIGTPEALAAVHDYEAHKRSSA